MAKLVLAVLVVTLEDQLNEPRGGQVEPPGEPGMSRLAGNQLHLPAPCPSQAPVQPAGLTERELEVLRLIAAGKRNWEIADELMISLFTVARHVSNIFCKTGAANRAEAAVFAARQGLL